MISTEYVAYVAIPLRLVLCKLSLNVVLKPKRIEQMIDIDTLKLGDQIIHRVRSTKFLGIHIDNELEWGNHVEHIASGSYAI